MSVDAIVCSHPHPDHVGGLCTAEGTPLFPNASIYRGEGFLLDQRTATGFQGRCRGYSRSKEPPAFERSHRIFRDEKEFLPGVQALFTQGHTEEHVCFMLTSGARAMCLISDVAHHSVLLLEQPRIEFIYDLDPHRATETRVKVLDILSRERLLVFGYHFPWPSIGHVAGEGDGFRFYPEAIQW